MAHSGSKPALEDRVIRAAEAALSQQRYVSPIDVLCGMGLLHAGHVGLWRKGRVSCLEEVIQGNLSKISSYMATFRSWALEKGLTPRETGYVRRTRGGTLPLRFSKSGDSAIEKNYRTHYVDPALSDRKQQSLQQKLDQASPLVVYEILGTAQCSECGAEMEQGSLLFKEAELPLCMACAGLGDLDFLAAGDMALTRRAAKYSTRTAVVVRFSRVRKRYERQGILVETAALDKAERDGMEDAEERAAARVRDAVRRREEDRHLAIRMASQIALLFPGCPKAELTAIAQHTATRGGGRVGRTQAGRNLREEALTAAIVAAIRHKHTSYDKLLSDGMERASARHAVAECVEQVLAEWRKPIGGF